MQVCGAWFASFLVKDKLLAKHAPKYKNWKKDINLSNIYFEIKDVLKKHLKCINLILPILIKI